MSSNDLSKLAASLTDAQRRAMGCAKNDIIPSHYPTAYKISQVTIRALNRAGITSGWPPRLPRKEPR